MHELATPAEAPFRYSELDMQESIVAILQEAGQLHRLGSGPFMYEVLGVLSGRESWLTPLTHHRARNAIHHLLQQK